MFSSGRKVGAARRIDDQPSARESLADVVVGVAFQLERHALGQKRAEALAGRPVELEADGVVGQSRGAVPPRDLAAQHRAHRAVHVADRQLDLDRRAVLDGFARVIDQLVIERLGRGRGPAPARSAARCGWASAGCRGSPKGRAPWPSSDRWPARVSSMSTRPTISSKRAEAQLRHVLRAPARR